MINIKQQQQALPVSIASKVELEPAHRLLVLVPCLEADLTAVTHRVWEIANAAGVHVKFIGLCTDAAEESGLRRRLVTMSAMLNDGRVTADAEILSGRDWVEAVRSRWQRGDRLVCLAEQRAGLMQKPLSQILQSDLDVPLTILSGLAPAGGARSKWTMQAIAWTGLIAIVLGFGLLQVKIYQDATAWTTGLMLVSIAMEYWMIWLWNKRFR